MRRRSLSRLYVVILTLMMWLLLACSVTTDTPSKGADQTQIAISIEQTTMAMRVEQLTQLALVPTQLPPTNTVPPTQTELPTYTPYPTYTVPAATQPPIALPPTTAPPTSEPAMDIEALIRGSNVLIYEDIAGHWELGADRRVSQAVNNIDFNGGRVINVNDAMGDFKAQLLSSTKWDLIIASSEVRDAIQGEFYDYLIDHAKRKTAIIAETWFVDKIAYGKISPFLSTCGVSLQKDWQRGPGYDLLNYSIIILQPDHELFNNPNSGLSLVTPRIYWEEDAGDLLKLSAGGDAQFLAGVYPNRKTDYGLLTTCMEGRTIIMTFSTHDYRTDMMIPLWENMIRYTLKNHYLTK